MIPPTAAYRPDFITAQAEQSLIQIVDGLTWVTEQTTRRVQHYGYRYDYKAKQITPDMYLGPLPEFLEQMAAIISAAGYFNSIPNQVIVNEYQPGQGIGKHIDCHPCFGPTVASISLGSPIVMEFVNDDFGDKLEHLLEPRSLLVLTGESRYRWSHEIRKRLVDKDWRVQRKRRISLTFRTVDLAGQ